MASVKLVVATPTLRIMSFDALQAQSTVPELPKGMPPAFMRNTSAGPAPQYNGVSKQMSVMTGGMSGVTGGTMAAPGGVSGATGGYGGHTESPYQPVDTSALDVTSSVAVAGGGATPRSANASPGADPVATLHAQLDFFEKYRGGMVLGAYRCDAREAAYTEFPLMFQTCSAQRHTAESVGYRSGCRLHFAASRSPAVAVARRHTLTELPFCRLSSQRRVADAAKLQVNATNTVSKQPCVLNFYHDAIAYRSDSAAFSNNALRAAAPVFMEAVPRDKLAHGLLPGLPPDLRAFPPALVTQRCMSLNGLARTSGHPDFTAALQVRQRTARTVDPLLSVVSGHTRPGATSRRCKAFCSG